MQATEWALLREGQVEVGDQASAGRPDARKLVFWVK